MKENIISNLNIWPMKDTVKGLKRPDKGWEKISAKQVCGKGLVSKIHKELLILKINKKH